jgi:hypothetical protein
MNHFLGFIFSSVLFNILIHLPSCIVITLAQILSPILYLSLNLPQTTLLCTVLVPHMRKWRFKVGMARLSYAVSVRMERNWNASSCWNLKKVYGIGVVLLLALFPLFAFFRCFSCYWICVTVRVSCSIYPQQLKMSLWQVTVHCDYRSAVETTGVVS